VSQRSDADAIVERLLSGEVLFLATADWQSVQAFGSARVYARARQRGKHVHMIQTGDGLRVWADDKAGKATRIVGGRLFSSLATTEPG
jgi:hypothetical protein